MEQETRNKLQRATQQIRRLLEDEFAEQLEGTFDILPNGHILPEPGKHLDARDRLVRQKLVDAIEHIKAGGKKPQEAVDEYTRETAFTFLNRFVALRMLEARGLLQECVSKGDKSGGFKEFCGLAPGLAALSDGGYRLYLECLFDELSVEIKVLFDRRDRTNLLWPRRGALIALLDILDHSDLATVWREDETIGWVYQYFNSSEERKKMRDESTAPRNSRELAVRNQFFTPRYVVEFLTDNTLGRIWYEMRQGKTQLVDECHYLVHPRSEVFLEPAERSMILEKESDCTQEELLQRTVHIPYRPKKDPRDLKILDPACGSGHFLLYAFKLLITIYQEAWNDETSPVSEVTGKRLREDYPEFEKLQNALAGLILRHNLHGIDIDPRAAQIAVLALWLRAQKVHNDLGISRQFRPLIGKSNVACAEPMPGELSLLDDFVAEQLSGTAEKRLLGQLVRRVFDAMALAGEAGSLLKIEKDISSTVSEAMRQWSNQPKAVQQVLFELDDRPVQQMLNFDVLGITDSGFWEEAEHQIYAALSQYSSRIDNRNYQRRLFSDDVALGFSFIDLCRNRYDVVLMNPPFGDGSQFMEPMLGREYAKTRFDLSSAFVERALGMATDGGMVGAITSRSLYFLSRFEPFRREQLFCEGHLHSFVDLGPGVLDAFVDTSCVTVVRSFSRKINQNEAIPIFCFQLADSNAKERHLNEAIHDLVAGGSERVFLRTEDHFTSMPTGSIAYWISGAVANLFAPEYSLGQFGYDACVGLQTNDDSRFLRLSWEVPPLEIGRDKTWVSVAKGGEYSKFWDDIHLLVEWANNGKQLKSFITQRYGSVTKYVRNESNYFRCGLTYPFRTAKGFNVRILPADCIFTLQGMAIFAEGDDKAKLELALGVLNAHASLYYLKALTSSDAYQTGYVKRLPIKIGDSNIASEIAQTAIAGAKIREKLDCYDETSRVFERPLGSSFTAGSFAELCTAAQRDVQDTVSQIGELIGRLNSLVGNGFNLQKSDLSEIEGGITEPAIDWNRDESRNLAFDLVSYSIGIMFGRWTTKVPERANRSLFDGLPRVPPALWDERDETINGKPRSIFVDDVGHEADLSSKLAETLKELTNDKDDILLPAMTTELAGKRESIGDWCRLSFFPEHIKRYSKSRRQAPIYWQVATPSASYSVWLYYHQFTKDTFFTVLNEYIKPKLDHERKKLDRLRSETEPTQSQRKEVENQEKFVTELSWLLEEVKRIAPLWHPNLNDGVIINFAPLWRLVPQNKAWQEECKFCWDELVKGEYDWAHLAMHLWPERVIPKCVTDVSIAVAHGLEDTFWSLDSKARFEQIKEPSRGWEPVISDLVRQRTSPAVKAALQSLLETAAPSGTKKTRKRKGTSS